MECVGGWENVFEVAFGVSVSVVVFGEWVLDVTVGVLVLREMRGLRKAFVWSLM